jgi:hypothetical protein
MQVRSTTPQTLVGGFVKSVANTTKCSLLRLMHQPRAVALAAASRLSAIDGTAKLERAEMHLLVQPNVHFRRASELAPITELLRELLARAQTAVEFKQLHEIDDH